jgi:hypothetical protein
LPNASRPAIANNSGVPTQRNAAAPEAVAPPRAKKEDLHVQIEAPLVFRGSDRARANTQTAASMTPKPPATPAPTPSPAPAPQPKAVAQKTDQDKAHRGFFGRVKGFFSSIFH